MSYEKKTAGAQAPSTIAVDSIGTKNAGKNSGQSKVSKGGQTSRCLVGRLGRLAREHNESSAPPEERARKTLLSLRALLFAAGLVVVHREDGNWIVPSDNMFK